MRGIVGMWQCGVRTTLAVCLLMQGLGGCTAFGAEQALTKAPYPIHWDLSDLFPSVEDWYVGYERCEELIREYDSFRGNLDNADSIADYVAFAMDGELERLYRRLEVYAELGLALDATDPVFMDMEKKVNLLFSEDGKASSFVDEEIMALPFKKRREIFSDPRLAPYERRLSLYTSESDQAYGEEACEVISILSLTKGWARNAYEVFCYTEQPYAFIEMPDGSVEELDSGLYWEILNNDDYGEDFKTYAADLDVYIYGDFIETYAALLQAQISENIAYARLDGYDTALEAALQRDEIPLEVYQRVLDAVHKGLGDYRRYLRLHREGLGLAHQYTYHEPLFTSGFEPGYVPYEEAVDQVEEALEILGDDYVADVEAILRSGHADVYPATNKNTGGFMQSVYGGILPYVMLNYNGYTSDIGDLAHELGHGVYSLRSEENQPFLLADPTIFTQEVAATVNEFLYDFHMIEQAKTQEEELYYLEALLASFTDAFFTQMMFAEFEEECYETIEEGGALSGAALSKRYRELNEEYQGEECTLLESGDYYWTQVEHFYQDHYLFQYVSSATYAAAIVRGILDGEEAALEAYRTFLTLGASENPVSLLRDAGVDPMEEETYQEALEWFSSLVDTYEEIIEGRLGNEDENAA